MHPLQEKLIRTWAGLGPRFLPFADVATPDLPLGRLLRLSLFQVSVGMALVLLVGTLNRVMIVELGVPASLVAVMVSLPVLFAPLRTLIGFRSDTHRSALGWRRVPFIWKGTMLQFGGLAIMPFALLVLSGGGNAQAWPAWVGQVGAGIAFLMVGAGMHMVQTVGLALATDLVPASSRPKVVGLMYVMLLLGTIVSALVFGAVLEDFAPSKLIQVIQASAVVTMGLNILAMWKQESRKRGMVPLPSAAPEPEPSFRQAWATFQRQAQALRHLVALGLGTMAFTMQDVLLEPFGGQVMGMTVSQTTRLTATLALGGLLGFGWASRVLGRGADPFRMARWGALLGVPAFLAVSLAAPLQLPGLFTLGVLFIGFGGGLFSHGTLTATMNLAPPEQAGLALGAWGAVQATTAGVAVALGGILRDTVSAAAVAQGHGPAGGYIVVYSLEVLLLLATLAVMVPLVRSSPRAAPLPLAGESLPSAAPAAGTAAAGPRGAA